MPEVAALRSLPKGSCLRTRTCIRLLRETSAYGLPWWPPAMATGWEEPVSFA